ncbi:precorrin-2 dehydrogenase/sirohydrochlorin ferrochelatase family protein [Methanofollis fontis]|nr:bifunctional precorrin-2 dehydrogenase/sirohydrochlorin ferrochelatase [Methanofollis fontis]
MIDGAGRHVVIFGGGPVGARKAAYFAREMRVTTISRSFHEMFDNIPAERRRVDLGTMDEEDIATLLSGAFLAVAATSERTLNDRIGRAARRAGVLFNNADGERGDVLIPSVVRGEHYTLSISTGGAGPAVPRFLREHLQQTFPHLDAMIGVQERLRADLKAEVPDRERRQTVLRAVLSDPDAWAWIAAEGEEAYQKIRERYIGGTATAY